MQLTIYTPVYNKAATIQRTFDSLVAQTNHDFEWIVINDGSSDGSDDIIKSFSSTLLNWRYIKKENGGLSSVMNLAAQEASGKFILRLDGDDYLRDDAVQKILDSLDQEDVDSGDIGAVVFLTCYENGEIVGFHPFSEITKCAFYDYRNKYKAVGDRAEVFKTEVFKAFPMPQFEKETFCSESIVWNRISDFYSAIYIPQSIYVREYADNSITAQGAPIRIRNPKGCQLALADILNRPCCFSIFLKESINYFRYSLHSNYSLKKLVKDIPVSSLIIGIVPGTILYLIEKRHPHFVGNIKSIAARIFRK